ARRKWVVPDDSADASVAGHLVVKALLLNRKLLEVLGDLKGQLVGVAGIDDHAVGAAGASTLAPPPRSDLGHPGIRLENEFEDGHVARTAVLRGRDLRVLLIRQKDGEGPGLDAVGQIADRTDLLGDVGDDLSGSLALPWVIERRNRNVGMVEKAPEAAFFVAKRRDVIERLLESTTSSRCLLLAERAVRHSCGADLLEGVAVGH